MVLGIFINIGQISQNIVTRNIYYTSLDTTGFESILRTVANQNNVNVDNVYAPDQGADEAAGNGLKYKVSVLIDMTCVNAKMRMSSFT